MRAKVSSVHACSLIAIASRRRAVGCQASDVKSGRSSSGCAGFAQILAQHKQCDLKMGLCRSRQDAIEDTKTMQAAAAAVQQGIYECMVTASTNGCELLDILHLKSNRHIR